MTQKAKNISVLAIISLGIILGFIYGLIEALIYILNNNYLTFDLYNISLLGIQNSLNKFTLAFAILAFILIAVPLVIYNWVSSRCIEFKILNLRNFRTLIYSAVTVLLAGIIYYLYLPAIVNVFKTNSLLLWLNDTFNLGIKSLLIFIFAALAIVIVLICSQILSRVNILEPVRNIIKTTLSSKVTKSIGLVVLLLLALFNITMFGYQKMQSNEGPNVVLISIDTLRADHLSSYGYERSTSPNIDRIANEGVQFENAFSQAPWTLPAMSSIHTSLYPAQHGVVDYDIKIDDKFLTIAEFLRNNHYKTIGVISMPFVDSKYGFSQGFEIFNEEHISSLYDVSSHLITQEAITYLEENKDSKFFLWIHYFDPHGAYIDHDEFDFTSAYTGSLPEMISPSILNSIPDNLKDEDVQYIRDLYDEEIAFTDKYIGDLLQKLSDIGVDDNTIIVITSDHGEEFMERGGFGHRKLLYNELIRVPLIIYSPIDKNLKGINTNNVETRSIAKTIVDLIELPNNPFSGQNLVSKNSFNTNETDVFSNVYKENSLLRESVISKNMKLIKNHDKDNFELYDLYSDTYERNNIYRTGNIDIPKIQDRLSSKIGSIHNESTNNFNEIDLTPEDVKKLKALGYLQ